MRLLAIEDEPKVGHALQEGLRAEGYEVAITGRARRVFSSPAGIPVAVRLFQMSSRIRYSGSDCKIVGPFGLFAPQLRQAIAAMVRKEMLVDEGCTQSGRGNLLWRRNQDVDLA